jgi:potassium channel subfamily K
MLRNLAPDTDIKGIFSLQECLLALAAYIALGGIAYTRIFERWTLVDALYFSVVSLTTVGYGDLAPSNHPSKFFTCIFGMGGVAFLGIAIATIGSSLVEAELDAVQRAKKLSRKRLISIFEGMPHVLDHLRKNKKRKEEIQEKRRRLIAKKLTSRMIPDWTKSIWKFLPRLLPSLTLMFVGGLIMGNIEKWSRANSIYYSIITAGTQGYGDFSPQSRNGRLWGILFIPMAVAAAGEFLGNVANVIVERRQHARNEKIIHRDLNLRYLREMDENGNGQVSRLEFVQFMLKEMGIVEQELLDELNEQFDHLDATNDGVLEVDDLKLMAELSGVNVINATDENAGETVVDLI